MFRTLAVCALALSTGCLASSFGPHFGELEIVSTEATSRYSPLEGNAFAHIVATLRGNHTGPIHASAFLVNAPCPIGPTGEPDGWLARRDAEVPDLGERPTTKRVELDVRGAVSSGARYSALFHVSGENTIGPFFGTCKDFVATP